MRHATLRTSPLPVLIALLLTALIFTFELSAPAWMGTAVLYAAPVALVAMWSPPTHPTMVILVAAGCTILTLTRLFYFPGEPLVWTTIANELLGVAVLWAIAVLSLLRKRTEQKTAWIDLLPRL